MALTELLITASLILFTLSGAGWVLHAEWDRARCAYLVFEQTHGQLNGAARISTARIFTGEIRVNETFAGVDGEGQCGRAHEKVRLKKLRAEAW